MASQDALVQCQAAWWSTSPPGLDPYRLPDGRLCLVDGPVSTPLYAADGSPARRSLAQAAGESDGLLPLLNSSWVTYTDLQCVEGSLGPLCGACEPGRYATNKGECILCEREPAYHAGMGILMLFLNMVLVLIIGKYVALFV